VLRSWFAIVLGLGLVLSPLAGVTQPAEDRMLDAYLESAERAVQQGRSATAEEMFLAAIRRAESQALSPQDPRLIRSLRGLAEVYRAQGRQAEAEALTRQAGATAPKPTGPTQVFGTIVLGFVPIAMATVPGPEIGLTLIVKNLADRSESRHVIGAADRAWIVVRSGALTAQDFTLSLGPGAYEVFAMEVDSPRMSDRPFRLPLGAKFNVPDSSCVYVGRVFLQFLRTPHGSLEQANRAATIVSRERGANTVMIYQPQGSLLLVQAGRDVPGLDDADAGVRHYARAREMNCAVDVPK
jgi:tetratricopeptide repeat protein